MPYPFDTGSQMSVLAMCRDVDLQQAAAEAGAVDTGGPEAIKLIEVRTNASEKAIPSL